MGMSANGAKYGLYTTHFYWLGAVLAMIFLGIFMMPFYYGCKVRFIASQKGGMGPRFGTKTRFGLALLFLL